MKSLKTFKQTMRTRFQAEWDFGCQDVLGRLIAIEPENSTGERLLEHDVYVEFWFLMPSGSRVRSNGGVDFPETRTLGRLQLSIYVKNGIGTEIVDDLYEIWEPMWEPPGLFPGVSFEPTSPVQNTQQGETWWEYVTDVPFRWDDNV